MLLCTVALVLPAILTPSVVAAAKTSILQRPSLISNKSKISSKTTKSNDAYQLLARSIQKRLNAPTDSEGSPSQYDIDSISSALRSLSTTQSALKKIDGTAHEMYQRTHKSSTSLDDESDDEDNGHDGKVGGLKVKGRMSRNAARVGCLADALFAAELCELIMMAPPATILDGGAAIDGDENEVDTNDIVYNEDGTLAPWTGRKVVLNTTIHSDTHANFAISVLVIYERGKCIYDMI